MAALDDVTMAATVRPHPGTGRRYVRSREGCLNCKRRKVKCNEQRPRCSHCERLNMECKWRPTSRVNTKRRHSSHQASEGGAGGVPQMLASPNTDTSPMTAGVQPLHGVDEVFDYASFMWDSTDFWQHVSPEAGLHGGVNGPVMGPDSACSPNMPAYSDSSLISNGGNKPEKPTLALGSDKLLDWFAQSGKPPILAEVETEKKWLAMRQAIMDMAAISQMVRCSILTFANALLGRRDSAIILTEEDHYEAALVEVAAHDSTSIIEHSATREILLASLFLLSYVAIIETRLDNGYAHLKRAYNIFQDGDKTTFSSVEKQLLLWIRLLDGKAVSAGGDGLFLSKDDEVVLVEASPGSFDGDCDDPSKQDTTDGDIEDVLFQVLYQPGIVFYQKVQSFMGRISKIDPWHRSRGTVEDETEVMNIGASIAADLRALYDQRPPLMDYAVSGKLREPHISAPLAFVIARAFRTYLSNYYASKVHLHRVAYKTLPLTIEATEALDQIRKLARQMADDLGPDDAIPVNMLWPLLMLGVEEQDPNEKAWIKAQILRMEPIAGNARITAQVLEEVQTRQDAAKARMDIRSVMLQVFNSCFAIV